MKKRLTVLAALLACSTLMGSVHVYAEENEKNVVETAYGKGHEDYQEIKGVKYHFDEREAVAEILDEMKAGKR